MESEVLGQILLMLFVIFILAYAASAVFNRFGIPGLIGEIFIGIAIANIAFGDWSFREMLGLQTGSMNEEILEVLAELGVIFLLFAVGLETKVCNLLSVGKTAFYVALLGVIIPFILGYAFIMYYDGNTYHAMFIGAAMVATSVGITARVIKDMELTEKKESRIIIGAAVIDDIMGMIVLAVVAGMAKTGEFKIGDILLISISAVLFVILIILFCMKGIPKIKEYSCRRKECGKDTNVNMLALSIIVCLGLAAMSQYIGLAAIIGAFLAGMLFADCSCEWKLPDKVEALNVFLVSFFFVSVGFKIDLSSMTSEILMIGIVIIILAVISKYVGCYIGSKADKTMEKDSSNIIGIGMVPRGEVGIIVASIGLSVGVLSNSLYSVVVVMSIVTTIIAPIFLSRAFKKKYITTSGRTSEEEAQ
jgi:Kef-type K+ transport systems, membrane components